MADLLTVYDDDQANSFIDCMICDKRIRGETHYKIHVTTIQHLKKEEALVAQGQIPVQPALPEWTDIKHYLQYLNLDEPIIGLCTLVQIPDHMTDDCKSVLKYKCRMCFVEMDLYSMVAHIVGRKHRQKYLELRRPDLVTWTDMTTKQPGLVARAKSAVVEKQEGWGTPVPLKKRQISNVFPAVSDPRLRQPHPGQDFQKKSPEHELLGRPFYIGEKYEEYEKYDSIPKPSYPEETRHQRPYKEAEVGGRHLRGDDFPKRGEGDMHTRPYGDQGGRTAREDYKDDFGRGQFSRGDRLTQEKVYHEGTPKNRFNDKDLRVHRSGGSEYQEEQMAGQRYGAYDDRKPAVNPMSMHGRGPHDEARRGTVRELNKSNEMPGYPHMLNPRDPRMYPQDEVPAKKKKKTRFSDATAEEIALAHNRHSKDIRNENSRGTPVRAPPPSRNQFAGSENASRANPKSENVLDIFNEIQIENMDDAAFLKEKLCTVLKEFQAKKSGHAVGHSSQSGGDHRGVKQTDMRRDAYNSRDNPDGMYLENRSFQEPRHYEDDRRGFQDSRKYGDDPRAFRDVRQGEDDHRNLRETRHYGDESKRFDSYTSDRPYADDPRDFQMGRLQDNQQSLLDRRPYDHDLREKEQHHQEYSRAEAPRSAQEPRYYDDNYRGFGNSDSGRSWEHHKGRSMGFEDRGPENVERGFQGDSRMYAGASRMRSHPNENGPGEELYDPFNPSSSPPPEASSTTSLDKIASTLLELVARR